jgi:enamine deaminase RidA (YjgF/YER057c/UK114 family)
MLNARCATLLALAMVCAASAAWAQRKKKPEKEITQVLELPKDPPAAITAESDRLTFHVSPLTAKGLLSQQVRDGLKSLLQQSKGSAIVKIRAFVAGSGDMRRVQAIVSEEFTEKRLTLPVLSVVQVGGLPLESSQVVLESTSVARKPVNPHGLAFISGQPANVGNAAGPLQAMVPKFGSDPEDVRRVTCFMNSLEQVKSVRDQIATAFPRAASNFVQLQRGSLGNFVECEAVAALRSKPAAPLSFVEPMEGKYSQIALVAPAKLALTGSQLAFRQQDADIRLAFERLGKSLESVGGNYKEVAMSSVYPLTNNVSERVRALRFEYYDPKKPPASTLLLFEGLPSLDASFGIDVISLAR